MDRIEAQTLQERQKHCVCRMCGGPLVMKLIIYNQYGGQGLDLYCPRCLRLEIGTEPEIYSLAKQFVDKYEFNYYVEMLENERQYQLNISKICDIAAWLLQETERK